MDLRELQKSYLDNLRKVTEDKLEIGSLVRTVISILVPFWNILPLMAKYTGHSSIIWMQLFQLDIVSTVSMLQPFENGQRVC